MNIGDPGVPPVDFPNKKPVRTLLIGIGTGRCGTVSLSRMLNQHPALGITHEVKPRLPWVVDPEVFETSIRCILSRPEQIVGDVGFFWLPYIGLLSDFVGKRENLRLRIVALERPAAEVIQSYKRKIGPNVNHWTKHAHLTNPNHPYHHCFPKYDEENIDKALLRYCQDYRTGIDTIANANRTIITRIKTRDLVPRTIQRLFPWLGVAHVDIKPVKANQGRKSGADAGTLSARSPAAHSHNGDLRKSPKLGSRAGQRAQKLSRAANYRLQHRRSSRF